MDIIDERLYRAKMNAEIDKMFAEMQKINAEMQKMNAETQKMTMETRKLYREMLFYPLVVLGGLASLIGLIFKLHS